MKIFTISSLLSLIVSITVSINAFGYSIYNIQHETKKLNSKTNSFTDRSLKNIAGFLDESGNPLNFQKKFFDEDPGDAINQRYLNGFAAADSFGTSVSGAGDVNGDGYEDIIVGAPNADNGAFTASGKAYIYFGGPVFNSIPDVILSAALTSNLHGFSVSSAGDVNGDSYDDVIVGLPGYTSGQGRALIYLGGSNMNNISDLTINGFSAGENFGWCVSSAGDINGDGFADWIVGAPLNNSSTGKAYVFFGSSILNASADITITGESAGSQFGYCVSDLKDVNGDGYADWMIGAPGYSSNTGRAYAYLGGSVVDSVTDLTFAGSASSLFGTSLSDAGDVNGDGYYDIVIGSPGFSTNRGRIQLYLGGAVLNNISDLAINGEATGNLFGISVSSAGDFNCDGFSDIIAGAPLAGSPTGRAYIFEGGENMTTNADKIISGEEDNDNFGISVSGCGDINGDGNDDFIVGANLTDINGSASGRAYLYLNSLNGSDVADVTFTGANAGDYLGISVSNAGDVNGDGYDDVIVGAAGYNSSQGRAYIYYGGSVMNNIADVTFTGANPVDEFGISVSGAGDVNGDGFDDVIVGAQAYISSTFQGRAYIYFGGSSMNNVADVLLTGQLSDDFFGHSVSDAGDINADGYSDVIVGAYGYNGGVFAGRAYVYFGGSSMNNSADLFLNSSANSERFGYSVSDAGDVNGDGFGDVAVGAMGYNGGTRQGKVYIYFGNTTGSLDNIPDVEINGVSANDEFGYSVSNAGDINGDGYSDVVVGAPGYNSGTDQGRVYLYLGGLAMNNSADLILTGESDNDQFGQSVSYAGDLNNDGFDEVLVGAQYRNSAYVYYGGAALNSQADLLLTGEMQSDFFGYTVSGAGDVNNDGVEDLIVGAYGNDEVGAISGKAYVYFSTPPVINPRIFYADDVPFDQGGYVQLKWMRSGNDIYGGSVTSYLIERSSPPGFNGFNWQPVGSVPATDNKSYSFIAPTLNDSMSGNSGTLFFRITAQTANANEFWRSNIVSTYSVDNLAPFAPQALTANALINYIQLNWQQNSEADFHHYVIYRNGIEYAVSANSHYNDLSVTEDSAYNYEVAAVDIHGNVSQLSNMVHIVFNNFGNINLSVILEGFYSASLNQMSVSDTVKLYLRNSAAPYVFVDSSVSTVSKTSLTGSFNFMHAGTGNYYLAVRHRNTIQTWSSVPVSFIQGTTTSYNLTSSSSQAFGSNLIWVDGSPLSYAIYSGDVNQDGVIDATDTGLIDNAAFNFVTGYVNTDLTGDEIVDATDAAIADNNAYNFVTAVTP